MAVPDKFKEMGTFYKYFSGELELLFSCKSREELWISIFFPILGKGKLQSGCVTLLWRFSSHSKFGRFEMYGSTGQVQRNGDFLQILFWGIKGAYFDICYRRKSWGFKSYARTTLWRSSIVTFVEFRAKKARGMRYIHIPTDEFSANCFFIKIDLKDGEFLFLNIWFKKVDCQSYFLNQTLFTFILVRQNFFFVFIEEYKTRGRTFIYDTFWSSLFFEAP